MLADPGRALASVGSGRSLPAMHATRPCGASHHGVHGFLRGSFQQQRHMQLCKIAHA